jgi:alpha-tubulin suppressor-like RCC1 family protein
MPRRFLAVGLFFLLAGCGTLKINVNYGPTPVPLGTDTPEVSTNPPAASLLPTPTVMQTVAAIPSSGPTESPRTVVSIAAGYGHSCALNAGGGVECWGLNDKGQLGDGGRISSSVPVKVSGLAGGVAAIAAGGRHTCALMLSGKVKCWGENQSGQLGDGTQVDRATPVDVPGLDGGVAAIAAGGGHTCALRDGGTLWCWGWNAAGQLGDGTTIDRSNPVPVEAGRTVFYAIAAGYEHTCALTTSAGVKCWGANASGQLGDGTTSNRVVPAEAEGLNATILGLSLGEDHTCALMQNRTVQCWGDNSAGQLGNGTAVGGAFPVQVLGLTGGAFAVSAGSGHTCAITDGGIECWGNNAFGQLGNGAQEDSLHPVPVVGFSLTAAFIAAGGSHTCAQTAGGGVRCWGHNSSGQLGDGTTKDRGTPVDVFGLG